MDFYSLITLCICHIHHMYLDMYPTLCTSGFFSFLGLEDMHMHLVAWILISNPKWKKDVVVSLLVRSFVSCFSFILVSHCFTS